MIIADEKIASWFLPEIKKNSTIVVGKGELDEADMETFIFGFLNYFYSLNLSFYFVTYRAFVS